MLKKTKLTVNALGNPAVALANNPGSSRVLMGVIVGHSDGVIRRAAPDDSGEVFEGLKGQFRAIPASGGEAMESGAFFARTEFIGDMLEAVKTGAVVDFAFEAYVVAAKNPAGYSWELSFPEDPKAEKPADVLDNLTTKLLSDKAAATGAAPLISDGTSGQDTAPVKDAEAVKKSGK